MVGSSDSSTFDISRRQAISMLGAGCCTGLIPSASAQAELPERIRQQREISWATASTTTAFAEGHGETPAQHARHAAMTSDGLPRLHTEYGVEPIPYDSSTLREGYIDLVSTVALTNVMWLPWLGRWRYTFQILGVGTGSHRTREAELANIGGHAATAWQPEMDARDDGEMTLVTNEERGTPHAVGYPANGQEEVDDEWSTEILGARIDEDDVMFMWNLGRTLAYEAMDTFGGILGKVDAAIGLTKDAQKAYYDEEWRNKHNPDFPERDFTPWYYQNPVSTVSHQRIVEIDVQPVRQGTFRNALVDMRSEAVHTSERERHQQDTGIRNFRSTAGEETLNAGDVGRTVASNGVRLKLPKLPNPSPQSFDYQQFNDENEATIHPYCYVDENGDVATDDCLYVANVQPEWRWH